MKKLVSDVISARNVIKIFFMLAVFLSFSFSVEILADDGGKYCCIPVGKSMFLSNSSKILYDKDWYSDNTGIVTVDNFGIVHAVSRGITQVKSIDKNSGQESIYTIETLNPEILRNYYVSKISFSTQESVNFVAITNRNSCSCVKFKVIGDGFYEGYFCNEKYEKNDSDIWRKNISIGKSGKFRLEIECFHDDLWEHFNCEDINIVVFDSSNGNNSQECNLNEKYASEKIINFISSCEGRCPKVYRDISGYPTIGCGKRIFPFDSFYDNISEDEMNAYLIRSINNSQYSRSLNNFLIGNNVKFNQNQFDALLSFTYNLGTSWMKNDDILVSSLLNFSSGNATTKGRVVSSSGLRLRESPSTSSRTLKIMKFGDIVDVISGENGWYKVKTVNGQTGYCFGEFLNLCGEIKMKGRITSSNGLRLRESPSTSSKTIKIMKYGECVSIISSESKWYRVKTEDGRIGYCFGEFLKLHNESSNDNIRNLNNINKNEFVHNFLKYHHSSKRCIIGLLNRRMQELDIFFGIRYHEKIDSKYYKLGNYEIPDCVKRSFNL